MRFILAISLLLFSLTSVGQLYQEPLLFVTATPEPDTANAVWDATTKGTAMYVSANGDTAVNTSATCARAYSTFSEGDTAKVYCEIRVWTSGGFMAVGISSILTSPNCSTPPADSSQLQWVNNGVLYNSTTAITPNWMTSYVAGDTIMIAVDYKNGALYMGKNGVWQNNTANVTGVPTSGASRTGALISWTPDGRRYYAVCGFGSPNQYIINTGKYTFGRTPPTGYRAWLDPPPD